MNVFHKKTFFGFVKFFLRLNHTRIMIYEYKYALTLEGYQISLKLVIDMPKNGNQFFRTKWVNYLKDRFSFRNSTLNFHKMDITFLFAL